jgi:S-adenosylmethionine hydrolase
MANKTIKDLENEIRGQLADLEQRLETSTESAAHELQRELQLIRAEVQRLRDQAAEIPQHAVSAGEHAALEKIRDVESSLDNRIHGRLRLAFAIPILMFAVFGTVGYFGLHYFVSNAVNEQIGNSTKKELEQSKNEIEQLKQEANCAVAEIKEMRRRAKQDDGLIVLQTDYGSKDPYMATLKGAIYKFHPHARIEVITSEIDDFDIIHAAWTLWQASSLFPKGTVFVVVTNPGGITSSPILLETQNGHIYVGHDNGCFDLVVQHHGYSASYRLASPEITPPDFKDLFGGVDLFGPTAAKIARGDLTTDKVGPKLDAYLPKLPSVRHDVRADSIRGSVMNVDHYGNTTTNISKRDLESMSIRVGTVITIELDGLSLSMPVKATYGHVSKGQPVAILYEDMLQFAINEGNFASKHAIKRGAAVTVRF